jgi:hypothetical protein
MNLHNVRLLRKIVSPTGAYFRAIPIDRCKSTEWSFKSVEIQSQGSGALNGTIIALLDRDSELRHQYLQRRWQGIMS